MADYKMINFVKSRNDLELTVSGRKKRKSGVSQLNGAAVKSFYEELVGLNEQDQRNKDDVTSPARKGTKRKKNRQHSLHSASTSSTTEVSSTRSARITRSSSIPESYTDLGRRKPHRELIQSCPDMRALNRWLRAAQEGDDKHIVKQLAAGCPVDLQDDYGWTALMCAAHAGQVKVIKLLLRAGAAADLTNTQGQTAVSLAKKARKWAVVDVLKRHSAGRPLEDPVDTGSHEAFYCSTCQQEFKDTTQYQHETSTLHQFSLNRPPVGTNYFLTEANKGFQMMLREGWDKDKGLGPGGEGQKFPVKTVLKRDRKGLGKEAAPKAKVTHFAAGDADAVKTPKVSGVRVQRERTLKKKEREKQLRWQRKKEIDFRREFHMSDF